MYQLRMLIKILRLGSVLRYLLKAPDFIFYRRRRPRPPLRLQVEVTSLCNYRCPSCIWSKQSRPAARVDLERFKALIDEARPDYLVLTGVGEGLLNDQVYDMIRYAKSRRIVTKLDSNGMILDESRARRIVDSGLDFLSVSLDTAVEEMYDRVRNEGKLGRVLDNLRTLVAYRNERGASTHVEVTLLCSKLNIEGLPESVRRVAGLGLDEVNCGLAQRLYETDNDIFVLEDKDPKNLACYREILVQAAKAAHEAGLTRTAASIAQMQEQLDGAGDGKAARERVCYFGLYSPFVYSDGTMLPCCNAAMPALDSESCMKAMRMGNVFEAGFNAVWHGDKARQVRRSVLENRERFAYCSRCLYDESGLLGWPRRLSRLFYRG